VELPWNTVRRLLLDLAAASRDALPDVQGACVSRFGQAEMYARISEVVARRAGQVDRALGSG
jgi:hypothetical protein